MTNRSDDAAFRLPETIRPICYDATLRLDPAGKRFSGDLTLSLALATTTSEIILHAVDLGVRGGASGRRVARSR